MTDESDQRRLLLLEVVLLPYAFHLKTLLQETN